MLPPTPCEDAWLFDVLPPATRLELHLPAPLENDASPRSTLSYHEVTDHQRTPLVPAHVPNSAVDRALGELGGMPLQTAASRGARQRVIAVSPEQLLTCATGLERGLALSEEEVARAQEALQVLSPCAKESGVLGDEGAGAVMAPPANLSEVAAAAAEAAEAEAEAAEAEAEADSLVVLRGVAAMGTAEGPVAGNAVDECDTLGSGLEGSGPAAPQGEAAGDPTEWVIVDQTEVSDFSNLLPSPLLSYPFELDAFQKRSILHLERSDPIHNSHP